MAGSLNQWRVEHWNGRGWMTVGVEDDDDFDPPHIGPRLQEPSE